MGLLEKADKIKAEPTPAKPEPSKTPEPEPVAKPQEPAPAKQKPRRRRREKKERKPRAQKKPREAKILPDGFENASRGQQVIRRLSDFAVSWGWSVPVVGVNAWGSTSDATYIIIIGISLMLFNVGFMPNSTGRTVGNWVSRTTYVNSSSEVPHQSYVFIKGLTFPMVILGIIILFTGTASGLDSTSGQIQMAVGLVFLLPPFLDYLFYRFKKDSMGLWDTLYGGVWIVKTKKAAEAKGWLKKLEQLGDYTESQGWWSEEDSEENTETS